MNIKNEDLMKMRDKLLLDRKSFTILETIHHQQNGKLASLNRATLKGEEVICKIIKNERINSFIIDGFLEQVCKIQ